MKAEINNENKAKFFAQYWGQKIVFDSILIGQELEYVSEAFEYRDQVFEKLQLEIKPLSSISDEDAEECGYDNAKYMLSDNYLINSPRVFDHLRSKGYLVPWMGLSCEEIIEAGWAKYKE